MSILAEVSVSSMPASYTLCCGPSYSLKCVCELCKSFYSVKVFFEPTVETIHKKFTSAVTNVTLIYPSSVLLLICLQMTTEISSLKLMSVLSSAAAAEFKTTSIACELMIELKFNHYLALRVVQSINSDLLSSINIQVNTQLAAVDALNELV
ncbi:hypothetical protein VTO42DRAFT_6813 [Malbranchea cinnamomea]